MQLTEIEAYRAMTAFLDAYWRRGNGADDQIAALLGSMRFLDDNRPADPALWQDWLIAIEHVRPRN